MHNHASDSIFSLGPSKSFTLEGSPLSDSSKALCDSLTLLGLVGEWVLRDSRNDCGDSTKSFGTEGGLSW